jgi:hypothetical protein
MRAIGYILSGAGMIVATLCLLDYLSSKPASDWPIVSGAVISSSSTRVGGVFLRPRLDIRIAPDGPVVHATLMGSSQRSIPAVVTFRYGGNAEREVMLLEETNSLTVALVVYALSALLFPAITFLEKKKPADVS